jgi:hypothetical protein
MTSISLEELDTISQKIARQVSENLDVQFTFNGMRYMALNSFDLKAMEHHLKEEISNLLWAMLPKINKLAEEKKLHAFCDAVAGKGLNTKTRDISFQDLSHFSGLTQKVFESTKFVKTRSLAAMVGLRSFSAPTGPKNLFYFSSDDRLCIVSIAQQLQEAAKI